jgi:hypothetical protein
MYIVAGMSIIRIIGLLCGEKIKNISIEKSIRVENERMQDIVF